MQLRHILTKDEARQLAYKQLRAAKAARFPFPIEGRIPNFVGAEAAARRLRDLPAYQQAKAIKVNPDAPQLPVRAMSLADGKTVYMPSPRLRGAFIRITPAAVPPGEERRAASLSHAHAYGEEVDLRALARVTAGDASIGLVVVGSVAVTQDGGRAGKGEGYADMEYALLRELGLPPVPVVTTVHPSQIVASLAVAPHDLALDFIVTPETTIATRTPYAKPEKIAWNLLSPDDVRSMPVLAELRQQQWEAFTTPNLIAPNLRVLFVGINPGRKSAGLGHNFAGPGNHFWRLLHESGLTPVQFAPHDEEELLKFGIGITNIVCRASRGESDLSWDELVAGAKELGAKVDHFRPRIVALLGKNVYRAYAGLRRSDPVEWGIQDGQTVPGVTQFVAPNPSSRSTIPYADRLTIYSALNDLA